MGEFPPGVSLIISQSMYLYLPWFVFLILSIALLIAGSRYETRHEWKSIENDNPADPESENAGSQFSPPAESAECCQL